jgi:hypothetical protein
MDAGMRYVDGAILPNFGPEADKKPIVSGHPEIEMALIELYRTTGERKYVELAGYILEGDPRVELKPLGDRVHELRGSVHDEDEAAGARGAGDVRVLRSDGLSTWKRAIRRTGRRWRCCGRICRRRRCT